MELKRNYRRKKMKKPISRILIAAVLGCLIIVSLFGCISVYDPPRRGKVIDAETREPIEDAVVMGYWEMDYFPILFLGGPSYFYDAREAVTDQNGNFTLPGLGPWLYMGNLTGPYMHVYKKGYSYARFSWITESVLKKRTTYSPTYEKLELKWIDKRLNIPLRKLDESESIDRINLSPRIERSKIKRFLKEINQLPPKYR